MLQTSTNIPPKYRQETCDNDVKIVFFVGSASHVYDQMYLNGSKNAMYTKLFWKIQLLICFDIQWEIWKWNEQFTLCGIFLLSFTNLTPTRMLALER